MKYPMLILIATLMLFFYGCTSYEDYREALDRHYEYIKNQSQ